MSKNTGCTHVTEWTQLGPYDPRYKVVALLLQREQGKRNQDHKIQNCWILWCHFSKLHNSYTMVAEMLMDVTLPVTLAKK